MGLYAPAKIVTGIAITAVAEWAAIQWIDEMMAKFSLTETEINMLNNSFNEYVDNITSEGAIAEIPHGSPISETTGQVLVEMFKTAMGHNLPSNL